MQLNVDTLIQRGKMSFMDTETHIQIITLESLENESLVTLSTKHN